MNDASTSSTTDRFKLYWQSGPRLRSQQFSTLEAARECQSKLPGESVIMNWERRMVYYSNGSTYLSI